MKRNRFINGTIPLRFVLREGLVLKLSERAKSMVRIFGTGEFFCSKETNDDNTLKIPVTPTRIVLKKLIRENYWQYDRADKGGDFRPHTVSGTEDFISEYFCGIISNHETISSKRCSVCHDSTEMAPANKRTTCPECYGSGKTEEEFDLFNFDPKEMDHYGPY